MGAKKISYKNLGMLFSVLLHALVITLILIPENHLFKLGRETPIDFFVYSSLNKKASAGSNVSRPINSTEKLNQTKAADLVDNAKSKAASENKFKSQPVSSENAATEQNTAGAVAASALGDVTDDSLLTSPVQILKAVKVSYPEEAKRAGVSGKVIMTLLVDQTGHVREVKLISGPGYGLNEAAIQAAKGFLFKPAEVRDQKVSVLIRYTYRFDLNNI